MISSAKEVDTVRTALRGGVVNYLLKPFDQAALRRRLQQYAAAHKSLAAAPTIAQSDLDRKFGGASRPGTQVEAGGRLPKAHGAISSTSSRRARPRCGFATEQPVGPSGATRGEQVDHRRTPTEAHTTVRPAPTHIAAAQRFARPVGRIALSLSVIAGCWRSPRWASLIKVRRDAADAEKSTPLPTDELTPVADEEQLIEPATAWRPSVS